MGAISGRFLKRLIGGARAWVLEDDILGMS